MLIQKLRCNMSGNSKVYLLLGSRAIDKIAQSSCIGVVLLVTVRTMNLPSTWSRWNSTVLVSAGLKNWFERMYNWFQIV
jgi:hypothetical protein